MRGFGGSWYRRTFTAHFVVLVAAFQIAAGAELMPLPNPSNLRGDPGSVSDLPAYLVAFNRKIAGFSCGELSLLRQELLGKSGKASGSKRAYYSQHILLIDQQRAGKNCR